jgi:hypothetical protein
MLDEFDVKLKAKDAETEKLSQQILSIASELALQHSKVNFSQ